MRIFALLAVFVGLLPNISLAQFSTQILNERQLRLCSNVRVSRACPAGLTDKLYVLDTMTLVRLNDLREIIPKFLPQVPENCGDLGRIPIIMERVRDRGTSVVVDVKFDTSCLEPPQRDQNDIDPTPDTGDQPTQAVVCEPEGGSGSDFQVRGRPNATGNPMFRRRDAGQNQMTCFRAPVDNPLGPRVYFPPEMTPVFDIKIEPDCLRDPNKECEVVFTPLAGDIDPSPTLLPGTKKRTIRERLLATDDLGRASIEVDCQRFPGVCPTDWTALDVAATQFQTTNDDAPEPGECQKIENECTAKADSATDAEKVSACVSTSAECAPASDACVASLGPTLCKGLSTRELRSQCYDEKLNALQQCWRTAATQDKNCNAVCEPGSSDLRDIYLQDCLSRNGRYLRKCVSP